MYYVEHPQTLRVHLRYALIVFVVLYCIKSMRIPFSFVVAVQNRYMVLSGCVTHSHTLGYQLMRPRFSAKRVSGLFFFFFLTSNMNMNNANTDIYNNPLVNSKFFIIFLLFSVFSKISGIQTHPWTCVR